MSDMLSKTHVIAVKVNVSWLQTVRNILIIVIKTWGHIIRLLLIKPLASFSFILPDVSACNQPKLTFLFFILNQNWNLMFEWGLIVAQFMWPHFPHNSSPLTNVKTPASVSPSVYLTAANCYNLGLHSSEQIIPIIISSSSRFTLHQVTTHYAWRKTFTTVYRRSERLMNHVGQKQNNNSSNL